MKQPPKYAKIGSFNCLRLTPDKKSYYRDAGQYHVFFEQKDGKLFIVRTSSNLDGKELIECTEQEWRDSNRGYLKPRTK